MPPPTPTEQVDINHLHIDFVELKPEELGYSLLISLLSLGLLFLRPSDSE